MRDSTVHKTITNEANTKKEKENIERGEADGQGTGENKREKTTNSRGNLNIFQIQ